MEQVIAMDNKDRAVVLRALSAWASYARGRANEIAQDRNNFLGLPASAVTAALNEAQAAERLQAEFYPVASDSATVKHEG